MHKAKFEIKKVSGGHRLICSKRKMVESKGRHKEKREKWVPTKQEWFNERYEAVQAGQKFVRKEGP